MPPFGPKFERVKSTQDNLSDLRCTTLETKASELMQSLLPYRDIIREGFLGLRLRVDQTAIANYRAEGQPDDRRTSAWLTRRTGGMAVSLCIQEEIDVGGEWLPIGKPELRAYGLRGAIHFRGEEAVVAKQGSNYERETIRINLLDTLKEIETAELVDKQRNLAGTISYLDERRQNID